MIECFNYSGTWSRLWIAAYDILFPFLIYVSIVSAPLVFVMLRQQISVQGGISLVVSFTALGGILGWSMGASSTPVVGVLMPAFLTLISALFVYLFSKEQLTEWRPVIPYAIIGMVVSSLLGAGNGAVMRSENEASDRAYNEWLLQYKNVKLEIEKEGLKALIKETKGPIEIQTNLKPRCD